MNGTITTRTFYIESSRQQTYFNIKASENGRLIKEYRNGQITQNYQADIFGVLALISDLVNEKWQGQAIFYINSSLIVEEHEGNPSDKWYGFKDASTKTLRQSVGRLDKVERRRWYYSALAHLRARENGIDLVLKHLDTKNIKLVNGIMSRLLDNILPATPETGK